MPAHTEIFHTPLCTLLLVEKSRLALIPYDGEPRYGLGFQACGALF
ncbi:MAG: hypothetical protein K0R64_3704 [Novosphingobium lindaniclasticum]|nr:hypothetical protein [Novosphingobium lindaniclasticum]